MLRLLDARILLRIIPTADLSAAEAAGAGELFE
jgi:hypothetical protein